MAYYDLNERAILAVLGRLNNNLKANIDAVNANTASDPNRNQTVIAYPASVLDAPPPLGQLVNFPIIAVIDGNMTFTDDVGWGATGNYEMTIVVYCSSPDPTTLAWQLRRYVQAVLTTVIIGRTMDYGSYDGAWGLILKNIVPGRRISRQDPGGVQTILSWTGITIALKDEQDAP